MNFVQLCTFLGHLIDLLNLEIDKLRELNVPHLRLHWILTNITQEKSSVQLHFLWLTNNIWLNIKRDRDLFCQFSRQHKQQ